MDKNRARYLWAQLCAETLGGSEEGPFERITALGNIATSHNLPLYVGEKDAHIVSEWLEGWAKAMRGGTNQ